MSGIEDISDDNNEDVDEKERVSLSNEDHPVDEENKPTADDNIVNSGSNTTDTQDKTVEDVAGKEKCSNDSEADDDSKASNADNALKVIAMCKFVVK